MKTLQKADHVGMQGADSTLHQIGVKTLQKADHVGVQGSDSTLHQIGVHKNITSAYTSNIIGILPTTTHYINRLRGSPGIGHGGGTVTSTVP